MNTQQIFNAIKTQINTRTTDQMIADAKVARAGKSDETNRMFFALIMDVLETKMSV